MSADETQEMLETAAYRGQLMMALADGLKPHVEPYIRKFYEAIVRSAQSIPPPPSFEAIANIVTDLRADGVSEDQIDDARDGLLATHESGLEIDEPTVQQDVQRHADLLVVSWLQSFELLPEDGAGFRFLEIGDLDESMLPKVQVMGPALQAVLEIRNADTFNAIFGADLDALSAADARAILSAYRATAAGLGMPEEAFEYLLLSGIYVT